LQESAVFCIPVYLHLYFALFFGCTNHLNLRIALGS
jgi:hypothetical protein